MFEDAHMRLASVLETVRDLGWRGIQRGLDRMGGREYAVAEHFTKEHFYE